MTETPIGKRGTRPSFFPKLWITLALCMALAAAGSAKAGGWQGRVVTKDGVPDMMNPATPIDAPVTLELSEKWEVGGIDDDELIFGVLTQITSDEQGNIYVLDAQLTEVMMFSPDGEYIRSIGREGEGPGEFRRPADMFLTPEGHVAVMQRMPGKIVRVSKDGQPMGNQPIPETDGMRMFFNGRLAGSNLVLMMGEMKRKDQGMDFTTSLVCVSPDGEQTATYTERTDSRDFANMEMDEKTFGRNLLVWTTDDMGRVYTSSNFDAYRIDVWAPDGTLERVIERDYTHRKRSSEEKERARPRVRIRGGGGRGGEMQFNMSDWDRDIQDMYPRADGMLWVLTSHGAFDADPGTIGTFDIYDREGRFTAQITLSGDGDFVDDRVHFVGDRVFVVKGFRTAAQAMMGGDQDGADPPQEEPEPMSVICYGLDMIVQGSN